MTQMNRIHVPRSERQCLIGRARLLRRTGKTYDEIRAALGVEASDDCLKSWLRGIPRPPETRRAHRLDELRRECRRLRASGLTYDEIAAKTGATKGSMSLWLRGIPGPDRKPYDQSEHVRRIQPLAAQARRTQAEMRRGEARARGRACAGELTTEKLFVTGVALYWAEGAKDKPWRRISRVTIINGDADVLSVFLRWLDLVGVPESDRQYRLNIHETADVKAQERWWANALGLSVQVFDRATLKRHRPATIRQNIGDTYHGCLTVTVRRSRWLYDEIAGAWSSIAGLPASGLDGAD